MTPQFKVTGDWLVEVAGEMMPMHPEHKHFGVCLDGVPMSLLNDDRCKSNHGGQSLPRIKERGGLSISEFLAIIKNVYTSELTKATEVKAQELKRIVDNHLASLRRYQLAQPSDWTEGSIHEEGGFEVRMVQTHEAKTNCVDYYGVEQYAKMAFPLIPLPSKEDKQEDLFMMALEKDWSAKKAIAYILEHYTITRK